MRGRLARLGKAHRSDLSTGASCPTGGFYTIRLTLTLPHLDNQCWDDAWCFKSIISAALAAATWDGEGEPVGWNKHPTTGRWREDGTPASEINQRADGS